MNGCAFACEDAESTLQEIVVEGLKGRLPARVSRGVFLVALQGKAQAELGSIVT